MPRTKTQTINGQTAVITGAGSGIGRAFAQRLARHGCPVAIVDWNEDGLEETASTIDGPVLARKVDVRDRQAQMVFAAEVAEWAPRPLGVVFNNAGVTATQTVAEAAVEDDEWVLQVNLDGVINGIRSFLPILMQQNSGVIVNTSSVFGLMGFPGQSAYCASKFAVRGYTESLRHELRGTGVRAITVHPGGIKTNILKNARYHADPSGQQQSHEEAAAQFQKMARTTPEKAAKIIHTGIERGRARIRIGADAVAIDLLTRAAPSRYFDVIERLIPLAAGRR
jgi:NADP-dependent 3-hydroxy acid dehydrogenase YdfG